MQLIDIGANLTHDSFSHDLGEVLERAQAAGVVQMVLTGTSEGDNTAAQALAAQHTGRLFSTAGIHPHLAQDWNDGTRDHLATLAAQPEVVAVGEAGLDFNRDFSPRPAQERVFEEQLDLAVELQLPIFMHERDAHDRFAAILRPYRDRLPNAVIHCFTGEDQALFAYLDMDLYVGITGWICDERRGAHLHDIVGNIPGDRLLLETDSPYLLPRSLRPRPKSRRNEPAHLTHVLDTMAAATNTPAAKLAAATTANARRFFGLPEPV